MTNGEDINDHKLQYFPNFLRGKATYWFARYETTHLMTTWGELQHAFISWFSEIHNEGQATTTLKYAKQKKYEFVEDYYDRFLQLYIVILQWPYDIYVWETFRERLRTKVEMAIRNMPQKTLA